MINKLISNLAFSPNLIGSIDFYTKRLNQESSVRKLGLVFIVLAMLVQVFAAVVPPEKSLAQSPENDVIVGGVTTIGQLQGKCYDRNYSDVRALYERFGLQCGDIDVSSALSNGAERVNYSFNFSNEGSNGARTVGRKNFSYTDDNYLGTFSGTRYYSRNAAEWSSSGSTDAYDLGVHQGTDGIHYRVWVLKDCGNIAYKREKPEDILTPVTPSAAPVLPTPVVTTPVPVTTVTPPIPEPVPPATCKDTNSCEPPEFEKEVRNITQNLSPKLTEETKAKAGDVIEYTLTTTNKNNVEIVNYDIEDSIGDILDYAALDKAFLAEQSGSFSESKKTVLWPAQTIPSNGELKKVFRVKMKSPLPTTNQPNATAPDFDCRMENVYGNNTVVPVNCSVVKTVEQLPNTGPGETIGAVFGVTFLSSYFFARSRLLAKEMKLIKADYRSSGA